jgi:hypothetical protein
MTRLIIAFFGAVIALSIANPSLAMTTDQLIQQVSSHIVKVQVELANGAYGLGSGVVVGQEQVVTNCHVVANAISVSIRANRESYRASALKPDWRHDLCILKVVGLNLPIAPLGKSEQLQYEQAVYTVGFAGASPRPNGTFGFVKGLFPMDDSVVVRASNTFRLGDSGGGMFDEAGNLVGIITVKSPGHHAFYYNMPVEWVQRLLEQPEQSIISESALPFWAESPDKWPFFMQIVQPLKTEDWEALNKISQQWLNAEPTSSEAVFYLALAEYSLKHPMAETHFNQVIAKNSNHSNALYYLGLIAEENGKRIEALNMIAALDLLDKTTAKELKLAIGIAD